MSHPLLLFTPGNLASSGNLKHHGVANVFNTVKLGYTTVVDGTQTQTVEMVMLYIKTIH